MKVRSDVRDEVQCFGSRQWLRFLLLVSTKVPLKKTQLQHEHNEFYYHIQ